jgi:hypothetical protein
MKHKKRVVVEEFEHLYQVGYYTRFGPKVEDGEAYFTAADFLPKSLFSYEDACASAKNLVAVAPEEFEYGGP